MASVAAQIDIGQGAGGSRVAAKGVLASALIHVSVVAAVWLAATIAHRFSADTVGAIAPIEIALEDAAPAESPVTPPAQPEPVQSRAVVLPVTPASSDFQASPTPEQIAPQPAPAQPVEPSSASPVPQAAAPSPVNAKTRDAYITTLVAWLNRHKKYPTEARRERVQGVVTVRFTIDVNGQVLKTGVVRSSGHPVLDEAALDVFTRANPVPAIPPSMAQGPLTLSVPIEFSLITR